MNVQVVPQPNGEVSVLVGGQTPLVLGNTVDQLSVSTSSSGQASIVDANGNDVTSQITSGSLAGLLSISNQVIPSLTGGGSEAGQLNTLASSFANTVNQILAAGSTSTTGTAQPGAPLFVFNASNPSATIAVNPNLEPSGLAAADPGPPPVANGAALSLANLESNSANDINGQTYTQYFSSIAAAVGSQVDSATSAATTYNQSVTQAEAVRQQISGVSLDAEATNLVQCCKALTMQPAKPLRSSTK